MRDKNGREHLGRSFVPETPDNSTGRAKRRSTMLSSAATKSLLIQQQKQVDSPERGGPPCERRVVEDTPDTNNVQDIVHKIAEPTRTKSSRKGKPLPSLIPSEETFIVQSQDILSSTVNPASTPSSGNGGSSSRRKKGKPFKIVQWDQIEDIQQTIVQNAGNSKLGNLQDSCKIDEMEINRTPKCESSTKMSSETLRRAEKSKRELEREFFEESYVEDMEDTTNKKKEVKRSKKRWSQVTAQDFVNFIIEKEKTPPSKSRPVPVLEDTDSEDDGWDVVTNEDGSIKKYLPRTNRKSVVISGNLKAKARMEIQGEKPRPKSRKNLSKELVVSSPVNSTALLPASRSRRSNRLSSISQISEIGGIGLKEKSRDESAVSGENAKNISRSPASAKPPSQVQECSNGDASRPTNQADGGMPRPATLGGILSGPSEASSSISVSGGYSGLSFQDFSTDSTKALMNIMEKKGWDSDLAKQFLEQQSKSGRIRRSGLSGIEPVENRSPGVAGQSIEQGSPLVESLTEKNSPLIIQPQERRSPKRKLALDVEGIEKRGRGVAEPLKDVAALGGGLINTPQRVFGLSARAGDNTSLSPLPMDLCDSLSRRSVRKSTQISTLASDGLAMSPRTTPSTPNQNQVQTAVITPVQFNGLSARPVEQSPRPSSSGFVKPLTPRAPGSTPTPVLGPRPATTPPDKTDAEQVDEAIEDLPPTQAAPLFDGLVFFVELRRGRENLSSATQKRVRKYGGKVEEKISKKVTHVIFQEGTRVNYLKARKLNLPLLSILWVEESIKEGRLVLQSLYPSISLKDYEMGKFPSLRKLKSFQLRTEEESQRLFDERRKRKEKRLEKIRKVEEERQAWLDKHKALVLPPPYFEGSQEENPLIRVLSEIRSPTGSPINVEYLKAPDTPIWEDEEEMNLPLTDRIIHRYKKNKALDRARQLTESLKADTTPGKPGSEKPCSPSTATGSSTKDTPSAATGSSAVDTPSAATGGSKLPRRSIYNRTEGGEEEKSTLLGSPILCLSETIAAADSDFVIRRRSGRQSTQICTKASTVLATQERSPSKAQPVVADSTGPAERSPVSELTATVPSPTKSVHSISSSSLHTEKMPVPESRSATAEGQTQSNSRVSYSSKPTRVSDKTLNKLNDGAKVVSGAGKSKSAAVETTSAGGKITSAAVETTSKTLKTTNVAVPQSGVAVTPSSTSVSQSIATVPTSITTGKKRGRKAKNSPAELEKVSSAEIGSPRLESTRLSAALAPASSNPKALVELENDKLFDALLQSSFTGRRSSETSKKKYLLSSSRPLEETACSSPRPGSSPRHHSSSARQWLSLAPPSRNHIRSPQRNSTYTPQTRPLLSASSSSPPSAPVSTSTFRKESSRAVSTGISTPESSKSSGTSTSKQQSFNSSNKQPSTSVNLSSTPVQETTLKPSSSPDPVPELDRADELTSPRRSRVVAPWRNISQGEDGDPEQTTLQDVYEFDGFPDETKEISPSPPKKPKVVAPETRITKFGRPSKMKMFMVAPKRKHDDLDPKPQSQSPVRCERSPNRLEKPAGKSPLRVVNPVTGSKSPVSSLARAPPAPAPSRDRSPDTGGDQTDQLIAAPTEPVAGEPRKVQKKAVLSRIFQKPPCKEQEAEEPRAREEQRPGKRRQSVSQKTRYTVEEEEDHGTTRKHKTKEAPTKPGVSDKKINQDTRGTSGNGSSRQEKVYVLGKSEGTAMDEARTVRKHKLYSQDMLDETAPNSPVMKSRKDVKSHKSSKDIKTNGKSTGEFKRPKEKTGRKEKRRKQTESEDSEDSNQSESRYKSSSLSDFKTGDGRKARLSRRSSIDFAPLPRFIQKMDDRKSQDKSQNSTSSRSRRKASGPLKNIVCTSCTQDDIGLVNQLVKSFGRFTFSTAVNSRTSHVISGEGKRTLNLLKGLLQGCWVVTKEWVLASLEAGDWVDEEPYEMVDFSPAVKNLRMERSTWGAQFKSELFKEIGTIYISAECRAPRDELKQLVQSGGGLVTHQSRLAQVVVGEEVEEEVHQVTEKWILDSVQFHVIMPFSDYPL